MEDLKERQWNEQNNFFAEQFDHWLPQSDDDQWEKLLSFPLFEAEYIPIISQKFVLVLKLFGDLAVGDEKLYGYFGLSNDVRSCPNKPAKVSFWFYELCLSCNSFESTPQRHEIISVLLHKSDKATGLSVPVVSVVEEWIKIIKSRGTPYPLLVFDSYYFSQQTHHFLLTCGVNYVCGLNSHWFHKFKDVLIKYVNKPDQWKAINNPTTNETVVLNWDEDKRLGKKMVMSNAYRLVNGPCEDTSVSLSSWDKITFSVVDKFNRTLHDQTWPLQKKGGFNKLEDHDTIH